MDEVYRDIYIEFTRPIKCFPLLSWIIRLVEGTKYSHVRLRWVNSAGMSIVYEASGTAVKFVGPLAQKENPVEVIHSYKMGIDFVHYRKTVGLCMYNAGLSYGFKQLIGIALVRLFRLKCNPLSEGRKSQVCSEIVGRIIQSHYHVGDLNLDTIGPKGIQSVLDRYPMYFRKVVK